MSTLLLAALCLAVLVWPTTQASRLPAGGRSSSQADQRTSGTGAGPGAAVPTVLLSRLGRAGRYRPRRGAAAEIADWAEALTPCLRAGLPPGHALLLSAQALRSPSDALRVSLDQAQAAARRGDRLGPVWSQAAAEQGLPQLAFLARAWQLSEELGASLVPAVQSTAAVLRERQGAERRLAAAAAGPRASMWLLTALPLSGPLVGLFFGVGPLGLYAGSGTTLVFLGAGVVLEAVGWWWSRRLLRRAMRPQQVGR